MSLIWSILTLSLFGLQSIEIKYKTLKSVYVGRLDTILMTRQTCLLNAKVLKCGYGIEFPIKCIVHFKFFFNF